MSDGDRDLEDRLRWLVIEGRKRHWTLDMASELTTKAPALLDLIERLKRRQGSGGQVMLNSPTGNRELVIPVDAEIDRLRAALADARQRIERYEQASVENDAGWRDYRKKDAEEIARLTKRLEKYEPIERS